MVNNKTYILNKNFFFLCFIVALYLSGSGDIFSQRPITWVKTIEFPTIDGEGLSVIQTYDGGYAY